MRCSCGPCSSVWASRRRSTDFINRTADQLDAPDREYRVDNPPRHRETPRPEHNSGNAAPLVMLLLLVLTQTVHGEEQQRARIGDLRLDGGKIIRDCVIGYRTFGRLNKAPCCPFIPTWGCR
jgi:hypothetical protein